MRRARYEELRALRDISFAVAPGEFFGIVGRNGSGKSTLLKCLAGIYRADRGEIWCNGRMSTFIELGVGFNPDLAAYDNVALNGIMMGLSPREARGRYERVIEFAELEEFQDLKLKNYSSGHARAARLLGGDPGRRRHPADRRGARRRGRRLPAEVLRRVQPRCATKAARSCSSPTTCPRSTASVIARCCSSGVTWSRSATPRRSPTSTSSSASGVTWGTRIRTRACSHVGDGAARVKDVWLGDLPEDRSAIAPQSEPTILKALVVFETTVRDPAVTLAIHNEDHQPVIVGSSQHQHERSGTFHAGDEVIFAFSFHNMLAPGRYEPTFTVAIAAAASRYRPLRGSLLVRRHRLGRERRPGGGSGADRRHPAHEREGRAPGDGVSSESLSQTAGMPIKGPRALTDDWSRFWHLTYNIARNEFKLKFFGSALGYAWQVMRPLLLFGVLYVFFVVIGKVGKGGHPGEANYGVQLLGSIVLFTFFAEATGGAVRSVVERENLVRKIQFPRLVIPLAVVLLASFNLGLNLLVVLLFALAAGIKPMLSWLELPLILAMLAVFATGLAMLLSAMFVRFRDIQPIWEVFSQILFYASPVIIPVEQVRERTPRSHDQVPLPHLHAQPARGDLPAVPPRDDQPRRAQRGADDGQLGGPARANRDRRRAVHVRLLVLQPRGPAHRRGPVGRVGSRGAAPYA